MSNGNPLANWVINNQYPTLDQPQPTALEFGATLPQQPPDGGGEQTVKIIDSTRVDRKATAAKVGVAYFKTESQGGGKSLRTWLQTIDLPDDIPLEAMEIALVQYEVSEEPTDPNPPSVELTLPRGSKGVDVSYWQGAFDWPSSGAEFGIIRCSDGLTANSTTHDENGVDRQFWANVDKLTALGIPWSFYHFLRPGSIQQQADKVIGIINQLKAAGKSPRTAVFDNGVRLPAVWIDVEDPLLSSTDVEYFYILASAACEVGIYTGKPVWNAITSGSAVWWSSVPLWIAAYGSNDGNVPNWPNGPSLPNGWSAALLWQYSSNPIDKNIAGPYTAVVKPPDPPTNTIDLLPYMMGTHKQQHTLQYTWGGGGTHGVQNMHSGSEWKIVKGGGDYEQLYYDSQYIYRAEDTSESPERFYTQSTNGALGAAWIKRHMAVGEVCYTTKQVQHYLKAGCVPQNGGLVTDKFTLEAIYATFTFDSGITLPDVAFITWAAGEGYYFAKGYGLVGFQFSGGKSYISELALQGRPDLPINKPGCIDLNGRFYV